MHSRGEPITVTDPCASAVARTVKRREMFCISVDTHVLGVIALQTHNHLIDHLRAEEWIFAITFMVSGDAIKGVRVTMVIKLYKSARVCKSHIKRECHKLIS